MRRIFYILLLIFMSASYADTMAQETLSKAISGTSTADQTSEEPQGEIVGGRKIKKEKKLKIGVGGEFGINHFYNVPGYDCESGLGGKISFMMTMPLSAKMAYDARWHFDYSIGFGMYSGDATSSENSRYENTEHIFTFNLFDMNFNIRCILNKYGSRGKWYVFPGIEVCPAVVGMPDFKKYKNDYTALSSTTGLSIGGRAGIGYQSRHICISLSAYIRTLASYSESYGGCSQYGYLASLYYTF